MKLLNRNLGIITTELETILDKEILLSKKINDIYKLNFKAYNLQSFYSQLEVKNIIELDDDYYVIENVKKVRTQTSYKEVQCSHIVNELRTKYWENDFEIINPIAWTANSRIVQGLFYTNLGIYYLCIDSHQSTSTIDLTKFTAVDYNQSNFMTNVKPYNVLTKLMAGTGWTVVDSTGFTATDFKIKRGSILSNIQELAKVFGGEIKVKKRMISIEKRIGADITEYFNTNTNLIDLQYEEDTTNIINKLYVYGSNGLTMESITGFKYVEDIGSINQYGERAGELILSDITQPSFLKTRADEELAKTSQPNIKINTKTLRLNGQTFQLGDQIYLVDGELNLSNQPARIFEIKYNPLTYQVFDCSLESKATSLNNVVKDIVNKAKEDDKKTNDKIDTLPQNKKIMPQLINVIQQGTISVETAHIQNAWINNLFVDKLETNSWGKDLRNPNLNPGMIEAEHNYIVAEDQNLLFITETLDLTQTESLLIKNPDLTQTDFVNVYYTAINGEQAFKYYTITKPHILNPQVLESEDYLYEVKVYKVKEVSGVKQSFNKLSFKFLETESNEVEILLGAGSQNTLLSNKFKIFKGTNTVNLTYYGESDQINGLEIKQTHIASKNSAIPTGGGHISNTYYGSSDPAVGLGQNGDIYIKI